MNNKAIQKIELSCRQATDSSVGQLQRESILTPAVNCQPGFRRDTRGASFVNFNLFLISQQLL